MYRADHNILLVLESSHNKQKWMGDRVALTEDRQEHRPAHGCVLLKHIEMKQNENVDFRPDQSGLPQQ